MKHTIKFISVLLLAFSAIPIVLAQEEAKTLRPPELKQETVEGTIVEIVEQKGVEYFGTSQTYQKLKILVTAGPDKNSEIIIENGDTPSANSIVYERGEKLLLLRTQNENNEVKYYISDYIRRTPMLYLLVIFMIVVISVSRIWGLASLFGLAYSFLVIMRFILPRILEGNNPLFIAVIGAMLIAPVTFFVSHGFNKKTYTALASTFLALLITSFLASSFIKLAHLSGFGTEEAYFLQIARQGQINMQGLLLAGIIIGTLGVLDDVTVTQASIVARLKHVNSTLSTGKIFREAMKVGHDHIASTVNTLILVYTGAALPLLLLFVNSNRGFSEVINSEILAEEVISTLVGSIGLILAVPITTYLAAKFVGASETHEHAH